MKMFFGICSGIISMSIGVSHAATCNKDEKISYIFKEYDVNEKPSKLLKMAQDAKSGKIIDTPLKEKGNEPDIEISYHNCDGRFILDKDTNPKYPQNSLNVNDMVKITPYTINKNLSISIFINRTYLDIEEFSDGGNQYVQFPIVKHVGINNEIRLSPGQSILYSSPYETFAKHKGYHLYEIDHNP